MSRILLVEDEVLIADMITRILLKSPQIEKVYHAISISEAEEYLSDHTMDLALLDIVLSGNENGLDLAEGLPPDIPVIFLTSSADRGTLERVKSIRPVGYLNKPVSETTLLTTIELALLQERNEQTENISLSIGKEKLVFQSGELMMAKADHVYTELHFKSRRDVQRITLKQLIENVPGNVLIRINRSEAVNPSHIVKFTTSKVWLSDGSEHRLSPKYRELLIQEHIS